MAVFVEGRGPEFRGSPLNHDDLSSHEGDRSTRVTWQSLVRPSTGECLLVPLSIPRLCRNLVLLLRLFSSSTSEAEASEESRANPRITLVTLPDC